MEALDEKQTQQLNNELLEVEKPAADEPRRNSKQSLIEKIIEISEKEGIPLQQSNTKLKRMSKAQLVDLCAEMVEKGVRKKIARTVNAPDGSDSAIALGALRMIHDMCALGAEKGGNAVLEDYGYEVTGFVESLKEPNVSQAVDQCLEEIAQDSEILEHVKSPYTRLAIAWGGALVFSCKRKKTVRFQNAAQLGPRTTRPQAAIRRRSRGRPQNGKVDDDHAPAEPDVKVV